MSMVRLVSVEGMEDESQGTLRYKTQSCSWGWHSFGGFVGLLGGIVAALIGSVLTVISWITGVRGNGAYMQTLGTDFLFFTIPLLILGAHCLDVVERRKKKERKSEFHENKQSSTVRRSTSPRTQ